MTRPVSLIDVVAGWRWFRRPALRRAILGGLIVLFALLAVFPRVYIAEVKLAPQDTNTAGLSSILSSMGGNYAALLGNHQPVEIDLAIGRSFEVQNDVVRRLRLARGDDPATVKRAVRRLAKTTDVRALRAGILEIEVRSRDPDAAVRTAGVYAKAMQDRLSQLSRNQTDYKRRILNERLREATDRLARAENAITAFRGRNQLVAPEAQLSDAVASLSGLRSRLQLLQVELAKAQSFNSPSSFAVQSIRAELQGLQRQIAEGESRARSQGGFSAAGIAPRALEYERLNRDLRFAQALFENYTRYLEGAAVEQLTADFNMQIIEPPYLEDGLKFNALPAVLLIGTLLVAVAAEFLYFRRPPGLQSQLV